MSIILEAKNLIKEYQVGKNEKQRVLNDVNLRIEKGEFISVMGPSGSGKSTLLYAISAMDRVTSGCVHFCGLDLSSMAEEALGKIRLQRMGFIFQQSNLLKNLNIFDNILLPAYLSEGKPRGEAKERGEKWMNQMGISDLAEYDISQVSGGQLQRASICRALMNCPEIIFGDEPTGALNSKSAGEIMDIFSGINEKGTTVFLVTHDVKVAARTERILFMSDGKIVDEMKFPKEMKEETEVRIRKITEKMQSLGI